MALRGSLTWHGAEVSERVQQAAKLAIDETLAACLAVAVPRAPYKTGNLRASAFMRPAAVEGGVVVGRWGFSALYAAYVELGTVHMAARPYMRPAADQQYPLLARRVAKHAKGRLR